MARSKIEWDDKKLALALRTAPQRADRALIAITKLTAARGERKMKTGAPWKDQTSNARNALFAKDFKAGESYGVTLGHGVPYGIWLEVRWSGKYAIVRPTVQTLGPEMMTLVSGLFGRMFKGLG